jgi:4-aminobutyrate aminotransferase/(S)-3-amino-2-methylpropionate transaminase
MLQQKYQCIGEVRGLGFMLAIEIVTDRSSKVPDAVLAQRIIDEARIGGLLVIKCGVHRNVVRFLAPLVTTDAQLEEALEILDGALERAAG